MSYDEQRISNQIDAGLSERESLLNEIDKLQEQVKQLESDKAWMIEYLRLVKQAIHFRNVHYQGIEQLITEMEG